MQSAATTSTGPLLVIVGVRDDERRSLSVHHDHLLVVGNCLASSPGDAYLVRFHGRHAPILSNPYESVKIRTGKVKALRSRALRGTFAGYPGIRSGEPIFAPSSPVSPMPARTSQEAEESAPEHAPRRALSHRVVRGRDVVLPLAVARDHGDCLGLDDQVAGEPDDLLARARRRLPPARCPLNPAAYPQPRVCWLLGMTGRRRPIRATFWLPAAPRIPAAA